MVVKPNRMLGKTTLSEVCDSSNLH